jgi:hypothetical protein
VLVCNGGDDFESRLVIAVPSNCIVCKGAVAGQVHRSFWGKRGTETADKGIVGCCFSSNTAAAEGNGQCRQGNKQPHLNAAEEMSQLEGGTENSGLEQAYREFVSEPKYLAAY